MRGEIRSTEYERAGSYTQKGGDIKKVWGIY